MLKKISLYFKNRKEQRLRAKIVLAAVTSGLDTTSIRNALALAGLIKH